MSKACSRLEIAINIDRENYTSLPRLFKVLKKLALPNLVLKLGPTRENFGRGKGRGKGLGKNSQRIIEKLENEAKRLKLNSLYEEPVLLQPRFHNCITSAVNPFLIGPEGTIYPCYELVGNKDAAIGNIFTGIDNIKKEKWDNFSVITSQKCRKCKFVFFCGGGCIADIRYGRIHQGRCESEFRNYLIKQLKGIKAKREELFAETAWEFAELTP
jgi:uncharacterized protein